MKFDFGKYTVDIELETISKKEILEEKIREGKKVIYDRKLNLVLIDENKGNSKYLKNQKEENKEYDKKENKQKLEINQKKSKNDLCQVF